MEKLDHFSAGALPTELWLYIFELLPPSEASKLPCVCRCWQQLTEEPSFWVSICRRAFSKKQRKDEVLEWRVRCHALWGLKRNRFSRRLLMLPGARFFLRGLSWFTRSDYAGCTDQQAFIGINKRDRLSSWDLSSERHEPKEDEKLAMPIVAFTLLTATTGSFVVGAEEDGAITLQALSSPIVRWTQGIGKNHQPTAIERANRIEQTVAVGAETGYVFTFDLLTGAEARRMRVEQMPGGVSVIEPTPLGRAIGGSDGIVRIFDERSTGIGLRLTRHYQPVSNIRYQAARYLLASSSRDGRVRVWDLRAVRTPLACLSSRRKAVGTGWLAPEHPTLLLAGWESGKLTVWDSISAETRCSFKVIGDKSKRGRIALERVQAVSIAETSALMFLRSDGKGEIRYAYYNEPEL